MTKQKLSWDIIKSFLEKELKRTSHILTFGTIGSCNIEHDIDTIITKKPSSPSAEFFKEIHLIFDKLDGFLNKEYSTRVIRFNQSVEDFYSEEMIKSKKIRFHVLIYVCLPQLITEWKLSLPKDQNPVHILKKDYKCILGSVGNILTKEFNSENYYSYMFTYIAMYDHVNFPLPKKFLLKISNYYLNYLYKKRLGINSPIAKNKEEIKKGFYELCEILDKKNEERNAPAN